MGGGGCTQTYYPFIRPGRSAHGRRAEYVSDRPLLHMQQGKRFPRAVKLGAPDNLEPHVAIKPHCLLVLLVHVYPGRAVGAYCVVRKSTPHA
jgi:hypothetical protein